MIELLFLVIAFILLLLVVVWAHFINQRRYKNNVNNDFRDETNVRLYHEHKAEIERDFSQGKLDQESYDYLLQELDQSLLQDIEENAQEAKETITEQPSMPIAWPIALSVFLLVFSGYMYQKNGAYDLIANTPQASPGGHQQLDGQQQALVQLQKLKKQTEQEPKNSDAWYSLGQALVGMGQFEEAIAAFDQVIAIDGEHADLFGAKAQASFYKNNQQITPEVQLYIDKALALDPRDPSTNILLGMNQFLQQQYAQAIEHWQMVVDDNRPSVNVQALQGALEEAKNRLALTGKVTEETTTTGPQLKLSVSLTDDIRQQLEQGEDRVVFIYAIPAQGSRMPVAAIKAKASDLPLEVILNDSRAMTPQAKLSDEEQVHVYAIVSATGGAGIKPGDYKAEVLNVNVDTTEAIQLVVDHVVK